MRIEIFGTGCRKCQRLEKHVEEAVDELSIKADIEKVEDISEIAERGVMKTPSLAIDGEVKISGRVPSKNTIKELLKENQ
ncbi:MAG: thioredoxin family protein [Thermoplasmatota archaeon]